MIVNGASRRSLSFWTKHLANDVKNDRAELKEIRGLGADNLGDALLEMQEDARDTRLKNFMYQANFSPCAHETLTEEQWQRTFEIFEKHRGIPEGQARVVYEHEKEGRVHRHVIWSRVDAEHNRGWSDALDAKVCHAASREISEELGLQRSVSPFDKDREGPRPERAPKPYEMFRGLESGVNPLEMKAQVTAIFRESENAPDFVAGLRAQVFELAKGDRRDYCIVDTAGDAHSLARRIDGVNAKQLREFMEGMQRDDFPSVAQAKERQRERQQAERLKDLASIKEELAWEDALAKASITKEEVEPRLLEPTDKEFKDRQRLEKIWPTRPPAVEPSSGNVQRDFMDAQDIITTPSSLPHHLSGVGARIWLAYRNSKDASQFQNALAKDDICLAAVTKDEADKSHRDAAFAKQFGNFKARHTEGDVVAVTAQGHIYKINQHTTGQLPGAIRNFLKPLDRSHLPGIDAAKTIQKSRSEEKFRELQASREKLAAARSAERAKRAKDTLRVPPKVDRNHPDHKPLPVVAVSVGLKLAEGVFIAADKVADAIGSIFAPQLTPAQHHDGLVQKLKRDDRADELADLLKYTAARTAEQQREEAQSRDDPGREL